MADLHPNAVDLTGEKFGRLTAVAPTDDRSNGELVWRCRCDCGREATARIGHLRDGGRVSCGCAKQVDLSGQRFGRLTALWPTPDRDHGYVAWECRCDCGALIRVGSWFLKNGERTSCGCKKRDDLTGMTFGRLTAVEPTGGRNSDRCVIWLCVCQCGGKVEVPSSRLNNGQTRSCGCLQPEVARKTFTTHGMSGSPEHRAWMNRRRRERETNLDGGWTVEMEKCLRRRQGSCVVCGSTSDLTVDHVRPLSRGFGLRPGNAVVLCNMCNASKGGRSLEDLEDDVREAVKAAAKSFEEYWVGEVENL